MARIKREASVILFDIGSSSVNEVYANGKSYFDNARTCLSMILQRKLFTNKNDVVGLFLLGTEETNNSLNYNNISLKFPLDPVNWEVLEFAEKQMKATSYTSDWLAAIVLGMQYIKDETEDQPMITGKKIILFSSFATPVDEENVHIITNGMKSLGIELMVIGPKIVKAENDLPENVRDAGETLISRIITEVGGVISSFDEAVPRLQFIEARKIKPTPWNAVMNIGPDIHIRVAGYKKLAIVQLPSWKVSSNNPNGPIIVCERNFVKQDAEQTPVDKEDVIPGYRFGSTIVPFSDVDDSILKYESGSKCLTILGFTESHRISTDILVGEGVYYFVAPANDENASQALSAFVEALHQKEMVAIARKIYRDHSAPVVGVLIPKITPKYECLVYIDLPFSEDIRTFMFPSLSKLGNPSEQQLECVDNLIDSMDLMTAGIDEEGNAAEAFLPKRNLDPYHQHFYSTLCDRGLNPDQPLPPVKQATLDLLKSPCLETATCLEALSKLAQSFPLVRVAKKEPRKSAWDVFKQDDEKVASSVDAAPCPAPTAVLANGRNLAQLPSTPVVKIGTVDPVKDFLVVGSSQPFENAAVQMGEVILSLVLGSFGSDDFGKAAAALLAFRERSIVVKRAPVFNEWMMAFKDKILSRGKMQFWEIVAKSHLGIISRNECASSNIESEAADKFQEIVEEDVSKNETVEDMDIDDLLS